MLKENDELIKWIRRTRPTLYTICRHVSSSGMFRLISVYVIQNNEPFCIDGWIENWTHYERDKKRQGLRVSGCGMDMGFDVVYNFSRALFPKGFHYRKGESHRNGDPSPVDKDGGYALNHRWLLQR